MGDKDPSFGVKQIVIFRLLSSGKGNCRKVKGSNRADAYPQCAQVIQDLYWPVKRATIMESSRFKWFRHQISASSRSGLPSLVCVCVCVSSQVKCCGH